MAFSRINGERCIHEDERGAKKTREKFSHDNLNEIVQ